MSKQKNSSISSAIQSFDLKDKYERCSTQTVDPNIELKEELTKSPIKQKEEKTEANLSKPVVEDPNELGAKLIRAELMGDDELVESLKKRLEAARAYAESIKPVELTASNQKKRNNDQNYSKNNQQQNQNKHNKKNRNKKKKFSSNRTLSDDEEEAKQFHSKKLKTIDTCNPTNLKEEENNKTFENCEHCFEKAQKHLIVSIGKHVYLSLPSTHSLVAGHCLICPINHCSSSVTCDEEVWAEVQEFRQTLVKMFDSKRLDCVFLEQYSTSKKYAHMVIECIPLGMSVSNLAPIYFKKAILESESEWAQNKSIIDLKKQSLRKTIPRNMPFFNVNFGLDDGYAHIIENSEAFPDYFSKEIIGGILDLDPMEWRRPAKDAFNVQSSKVIEFLKWWKSYDFNKK